MNNDNKGKKRRAPSPGASSMETSDTEDVSKLVSSGTSSSKSGGGIDKDDIYSSDDSTRHLEKVQETEHND